MTILWGTRCNCRATFVDVVDCSSSSTGIPRLPALKDLHARLDERGLFEPSRFWTRKLLLWVPMFFLSYLGLLLLPFGSSGRSWRSSPRWAS